MMNHHDSKTSIAKILNENYVADLNFAMKYTRWFFTILGLWPHVTLNPTKLAIYASRLIMPLPTIFITLVTVPLAIIPFYEEMSATHYILWLMPLSYRTTAVVKNVILLSRHNGLKFCIQHMESDWRCIENNEDRDCMMKNVRIGRKLTFICIACVYSGAFCANIQKFLLPKQLDALNQTIRPIMVHGSEHHFDLNAGYTYEILLFFGWAEVFFTPSIVTCISNLALTLVCHACGQVEIVMTKLQHLVSDQNDKDPDILTVERQIAQIIPIHVRALRFASKIDEILREMCLLEVVSATLIICLLAYCCVSERKNTGLIALVSYATLLISLSFNIFIFCQIGELLQQQAVGKAAYMIDWYRLPGKTGLALILLIEMSNYPRKLTAGKIIDLSILTFGNIMRMSFGYGNMLITMAD